MRYIIILFMLLSSLYAQKLITPEYVYKVTDGLVSDVIYAKGQLYVATDTGIIDVFNTQTKKKIDTIVLNKIKDFMGDTINSKIFSIDMLGDSLLILSQDSGGYSRIHIYTDNKLHEIISKSDKLNIIQAKFIDPNRLLFGLISNDIISYNMKTKKKNWVVQASMSKFSNFALNNKRTEVAIADESGDVHILSTKDGKKIKTLSGGNVDNVFSIAFAGHIVLTGGQDRRAAVYNLSNSDAYYKSSKFFVYGVGLSPSGHIGAYSCDIHNNVELFNTTTRESLGKYKATNKVVSSIYFMNEKEFFINSSSHSVGYYKLK